MSGNKLVLEQCAQEADSHWSTRLPGMGSSTLPNSFRGLYAVLYRLHSGTAHPSFRGINPVVEDVTPTVRRVVIEPRYREHGSYGMATMIFALALLVAAQANSWPATGEVLAVFDSRA
jgi:hypothetical protein